MKIFSYKEFELSEKRKTDDWGVEATGEYTDKKVGDLRKQAAALRAKKTRTPEEVSKLRELNFAIRAKTGWGKVKK
jgi:hypothetical protein